MTHATKTDAQLLMCGCGECKAEAAYREHHRRFPKSAATRGNIKSSLDPDRGWRPFGLHPRDLPRNLIKDAVRECPINDAVTDAIGEPD